MVVRSDGHSLHPINWPQFTMQDRGLKNPEDVLTCSHVQIEKRLKPPNDHVLKCPRCDSYNTKFCYYNNYSLSQPRHFCKNCRRYWTKGGAQRNVPVGGGCRKNKRTKQRGAEQCSVSHQNNSVATNVVGETTNSSGQPSSSAYFDLPIEGDEVNLTAFSPSHGTLRLADQNSISNCNPAIFGAACASQLSGFARNPLNSLSSHVSGATRFQIFRNGLAGIDYLTGSVRPDQGNLGFADLTSLFDMTHQQLSSQTTACAPMSEGTDSFNLPLNTLRGIDSDMQWKLQRQKMESDGRDRHIVDRQMAVTLDSDERQAIQNFRHSTSRPAGLTSLPPCTKVEERQRTADWQAGQEGLFETSTEHNYWNSGVWSDLPCYGPSTSPFP